MGAPEHEGGRTAAGAQGVRRNTGGGASCCSRVQLVPAATASVFVSAVDFDWSAFPQAINAIVVPAMAAIISFFIFIFFVRIPLLNSTKNTKSCSVWFLKHLFIPTIYNFNIARPRFLQGYLK